MSLRTRLTLGMVVLVALGIGLALGAVFGAVTDFDQAPPVVSYQEFRARVARIAVITAVVVVAGVAFVSWWGVGRALRPLRGIAEVADRIGAGELSTRVPTADSRTEVGRVGAALNVMLEQVEAAFQRRAESEERLRQFVADASHELRTPLATIRGYAELFGRGAASRPDDLTTTMNRIESEARRMSGLVEELLLLARLDQAEDAVPDGKAGSAEGSVREPVELPELCREAITDARTVDPEREWELVTEPGDAGRVLADPDQLRRVLANLLDNVSRHTPTGSTATVSVRAELREHGEPGEPGEHGDVIVEVTDDGPGIPADHRARVFERFYRGDPARSRHNGGSGLGLAIVASVVAAHHGRVELADQDTGTTIRILLPAAG